MGGVIIGVIIWAPSRAITSVITDAITRAISVSLIQQAFIPGVEEIEKENVWSREFTLITIGTIISAMAGQTINLPMSLMVFDETGSTLLSAFLFIAGMIPGVLLPILIAPVIDRYPKKAWIILREFCFCLLLMWLVLQDLSTLFICLLA